MRNFTIVDDVDAEVQSYPFQLPLHALYDSREKYVNYPPFQREEVWPDLFKFELIDSLVRGFHVPEIQICNRLDNGPGKWVLDGQQRLTTILQFVDALKADKAHKPINPEYFYFRLTDRQEMKLLERMIKFTELKNVSEDILATTYLRLNNQISLTTAEKLWASLGPLRNVAEKVYRHPFFEEIYSGRTRRKQPFQMAVYPVVVEMFKPFADMQGHRIKALARGTRKDLIYPGMADVILRKMDYVHKLFSGVSAAAMTELIIMYQAVWLLDFIGADLEATPAGALVDWYRSVERLNSEYRVKGFMNLFAQFTSNKVQRQQWQVWLDQIVYSGVLELGNKEQERQILAQLQRVTGWLRRNGICDLCRNPHVQLRDVERHVFRPADSHRPNFDCRVDAKKILLAV